MTSTKDTSDPMPNKDILDEILGTPNEMMTSWQIERLVKAKAQILANYIKKSDVLEAIGEDTPNSQDGLVQIRVGAMNQLRAEIKKRLELT